MQFATCNVQHEYVRASLLLASFLPRNGRFQSDSLEATHAPAVCTHSHLATTTPPRVWWTYTQRFPSVPHRHQGWGAPLPHLAPPTADCCDVPTAPGTALPCLEHIAIPMSSRKVLPSGPAARPPTSFDQEWDEFSPLELITARLTRSTPLTSADSEAGGGAAGVRPASSHAAARSPAD